MCRLVLALAVSFGLSSSAFAQVILTQDFTTSPSWLYTGSGSNSNNFGYRTTSIAGGNPGEAGGRFTRSHFDRIYADTNLGGYLSLATPFAAAGQMTVVDGDNADLGPGLVIGHFNLATQASVGLVFNQDLTSTDGMYLDAIIRFGDNNARQVRLISSPLANVQRSWSYSWDPSGGLLGGGRLTASVSGSDGATAFLDLSAADYALAPTFGAFGLYAATTPASSGNPNQPTWLVETYIDNVSYTAAPEPGSLVLGTLGVFVSGFVARLRRSRKQVQGA